MNHDLTKRIKGRLSSRGQEPFVIPSAARELLWRAYGRAAWSLIWGTCRSARWTVVDRYRHDALKSEGRPYIFAFWHGRQFVLPYAFRHGAVRTLVSKSRDGELIHRPLICSGSMTVRGSTSRGGSEAYIQLIDHVNQGALAAFTPDGPRGPAGTVAPGVIALAKRCQAPIAPLAAAAVPAWRAASWDRFLVPKPFSAVTLVFGKPLLPPPDADDPELERLRLELKRELDRITEAADLIVTGRDLEGYQIERLPARGLPSQIPSRPYRR